jgi:hypothetical protein
MMQRHCFNIILFFLFLIPVLAHGHAPCEKLERVVETEQGEKIKLVRMYWDGIIELDPVQLVAYDESAFPFFETSTGRDVFVSCKEKNDCFVFLFKGFLSVVPEEVYEIKNQSVVRVDEFWTKVRGVFTPLQKIENYLVTMMFLFASLLLGFYSNRMRKEKRELVATALLLSGLFVLFVFVCVVDVSRVVFLPLTVLTGIVAAVGFVFYKIEARVRAKAFAAAHKVKKHGKIHAELIRSDRAFEFIAKKFDEDSDACDNWDALIDYIPFMAFSNRSFIVAEIGPPEWSIVYDHIQDYKQPFVKKEIDGIECVVTKVNSASKKQLNEITQEYNFYTYALLWLIAENDVNTPVVEEIYNLRKKYPCDAEKWYECKTEFMLGIEDGSGIVWNRPNMTDKEFIDKIQEFCFEKNIGIDIEVVDGEKS